MGTQTLPDLLTAQIPAHSNIAIPRGVTPPRVQHAPIEWHRFDSSHTRP